MYILVTHTNGRSMKKRFGEGGMALVDMGLKAYIILEKEINSHGNSQSFILGRYIIQLPEPDNDVQ